MSELPAAVRSVVARLPRALGLAAGLFYTVYVMATAGLLFLVGGMGCDEGCMPRGEAGSWQEYEGAWQWWVLIALAVAVFATGIWYFAAVLEGERRLALIAWLLHPLLFLAGPLWKSGSISPSEDFVDAQILPWFLLCAATGLLGIGLACMPGRGRDDAVPAAGDAPRP